MIDDERQSLFLKAPSILGLAALAVLCSAAHVAEMVTSPQPETSSDGASRWTRVFFTHMQSAVALKISNMLS